jgi:hypothetical protein
MNVRAAPRPKACLSAKGQWDGLQTYLRHGHVEPERSGDSRRQSDNNSVENAIRPCALGKKNYLFIGDAGAGQRSAVFCSLPGTCLRRGINPRDYLHWLLRAPARDHAGGSSHPDSRGLRGRTATCSSDISRRLRPPALRRCDTRGLMVPDQMLARLPGPHTRTPSPQASRNGESAESLQEFIRQETRETLRRFSSGSKKFCFAFLNKFQRSLPAGDSFCP